MGSLALVIASRDRASVRGPGGAEVVDQRRLQDPARASTAGGRAQQAESDPAGQGERTTQLGPVRDAAGGALIS